MLYFAGGYCKGPEMARSLKESILKLCSDLKTNAVSIVDALAPPDFVLNSVLGTADGKVNLIIISIYNFTYINKVNLKF